MTVLQTERLALRRLSPDDAEFILDLLNQPSFLRYIGDKGVRNTEEAINYIQTGPVASYEEHGFGLYLVQLKETGASIGICGLLKRETLPDVDIGFAFLPAYWSRGYALEAAEAMMKYGRELFGLQRIVAITSLENESSIKLLEKLGMKFEGLIKLGDDEREVRLFGTSAGSAGILPAAT
nr:Acetyltransferase (GNAT) domain protein [uncultured bacterium]